MQIKVTDTRIHKVVVYSPTTKEIEVPVADAKLVLVECKKEEGGLLWKNSHGDLLKDFTPTFGWDTVKCFKPILISETEKVEVGDWFWDNVTGVNKCISYDYNTNSVNGRNSVGTKYQFFKILALPEHFSPKHLQAIVDGKLKEGKVTVECEQKLLFPNARYHWSRHPYNVIKLNSSNRITLYKVEEKMYPLSVIKELLKTIREFKVSIGGSHTPLTDKDIAIMINQSIDNAVDYGEEWFFQTQ